MKELRFSDDVIANVAKVLQIAIITGTDIVDNLRMMRLVEGESGILEVHGNFKEALDGNIEKMLSDINNSDNLEEPQA